ncbi:MAG: glycoside hydrolase family 3 N-terminal domain-containing protein [Saprospiraceae bacterium]
MSRNIITLLLIALFSISANQKNTTKSSAPSPELQKEQAWVEQTFKAMSPDERLGQLFMVRAHSDKGPAHIAGVEKMIKEYHVGSLCFFQGTPEKQTMLLNRYQKMTKRIPLMIAMDAEWGLGMRFPSSTISFPQPLMLGAIQDNRLIYEMGKEVAQQLRRLGVHINFAPVADVNNNPKNPVINTRSFGEDRYNVAVKSYMYMQGMQDANVMACGKHFPGHGDTGVDSHYDLPVITHGRNRLDSIELFPFKVLVQHGIQSMMVAHLHVPSIDNVANRPTTLSTKAVTDLLKNEMGFEGLIFTDGLGMKGVTKHYKPGVVEAEALLAGNDVLLLPQDIAASFKAIKAYLAAGKLSQAKIDESVRKVLRAKYRLNLRTLQQVSPVNLRADLTTDKAQSLKRRLIENALTMVRNEAELVPFRKLDQKKFASLSIGSTRETAFQKSLDHYAPMKHYQVGKKISPARSAQLLKQLGDEDIVIVGLHDMSRHASKNFGVTESTKRFLAALQQKTKVVLTIFGNPYSLKYFDQMDWVLAAYEEDDMVEDVAGQALFGAFSMQGRLPITASPKSQYNYGHTTDNLFRLGYDLPVSVGMDAQKLTKIDDLMQEAMRTKALPGGVVLVAKDGKVVFHKAYGHHTYAKKQKVRTNDVYDLASITKIASSTISVMKLQEDGKIRIDQPMSDYLPELKGTNKEGLLIQDIMAHRAGLKPWIPFFEQTVTSSKRNPRPMSKYYKKKKTKGYSILVAKNLYLKDDFTEEMWRQIRDSDLRSTREYKYSDLGFYLLMKLIERQSNKSQDQYVQESFYGPLGLSTASYNPLDKIANARIVPSENDRYFRRQVVDGYVHDMGAAMLGGVSGHAGLFANANDLAIVMQMLLNKGYYGGLEMLQPSTVELFTKRHTACTRRGIGFDLRQLNPTKSQNMCAEASDNTFGHLGFTGTCTWADPDRNIVYVFLSNRTYPTMKNNKLGSDNYRPRIQQIIYEAITH